MTEEPQKKLILIGLALITVITGIALVFALFFNRGKLILIGQAPFFVEIPNVKTITCFNDECELVLIPNQYQITIQKPQFKSQKIAVKVPLGGKTSHELNFEFIPYTQIVSDLSQVLNERNTQPFQKKLSEIQLKNWPNKGINWADLPTNFKSLTISPDATTAILDNGKTQILYNFSTQQSQLLNITTGQKVFYDQAGKTLYYIDLDAKTSRQTLYSRALSNLENPLPLTTFPRSIKNYQLIPSPDAQKILLLDTPINTVYLIDTKQKTRTSIYSQGTIASLKWLPEGDGFIIEGNGKNVLNDENADSAAATSQNQLTWFDLNSNKTLPLSIAESLKNVIPQANHQLIIASSSNNSLINYNLENGLKTQLFTFAEIPFPIRTESSSQPNEILFQSENSLYSLFLSPNP